jgi:hypothetical protein
LGAGFHRASDAGFVGIVRHTHQRHQADAVGGQHRVLDGAGIGRQVLGVEHDKVDAAQPQDLYQGAIAGKTLHSQRILALSNHLEQAVIGVEHE